MKDNITWHWCGKHQKWAGHKETDCQGVGVFISRGNQGVSYVAEGDDTPSNTSKLTNPTAQVNKALMSNVDNNGSLFK
jgi:hypothetical protein